MNTLFLDLDGVFADFEKYFEDYFGVKHDTMTDREMWQKIDGHGKFFRNLPPMPGALDFFHEVIQEGQMPIILTACPRTNYYEAATQKIEWAHEHLSPHVHVLPVLGGKNKCLFMHRPGDILIDDFEKNLIPWTARGGRSILHTDFDSTYAQYKEISAGDWD